MDRRLTYPGAIPVETDFLWAAREAMVGLGCLYNDLIGTQTLAARLPCTPSGMTVSIGAGSLYSQQQIDKTPYSSLPINTNLIVKQGLLFTPVGFACPAPGSGTQHYLIEGAFAESDVNLVTLPYFNAANFLQAYSGPGNNGQAQATLRQCAIVLTLKSGTSAPAVDAGNIALYTLAVPAGTSAITTAMITQITANFLPQGPYIPIADGPFVTPTELAVDLIPYATVAQLDAAVAPLATTAALNADIAPLATTAALNAAVEPLATTAALDAAIAPLATTAALNSAVAPLATTAALDAAIAPLAPLESPHFTDVPTAPTAVTGTNSDQIATCAFVDASIGGSGASSLGVNGYQTFASGLTIQWGQGVAGTGVAFPIEMTTLYSVVISGQAASGSNPTQVYLTAQNGQSFTTGSSDGSAWGFNWFATGKL